MSSKYKEIPVKLLMKMNVPGAGLHFILSVFLSRLDLYEDLYTVYISQLPLHMNSTGRRNSWNLLVISLV